MGKLEVDELITKQLVADEKTDRQYIESHQKTKDKAVLVQDLFDKSKQYTRQFVYLNKLIDFIVLNLIELHKDKDFMIGLVNPLSQNTLGSSVVK